MANDRPVDRAHQFWLAQPTETFRLGAGDLAKKIRRLEADARNARTQSYVSAVFPVIVWIAMFFVIPGWISRAGALVALLGWTYSIQQSATHSRRTIAACVDMADLPTAAFVRESLERERAFLSGSGFRIRWVSMVAGPVLFGLGVAISDSAGLLIGLVLAIAWIAISMLAFPARTKKLAQIQKQLDELQLYTENRIP